MLTGNNLIWKSWQTTKGKFPELQYTSVNSRLLWKHKHSHTCHGKITFINMSVKIAHSISREK